MPKLLIIVVLVLGVAIVLYRSPNIAPMMMSSTRGVVKVEAAPPDVPKADKRPEPGTPHRKSESIGGPKKIPEQVAANRVPSYAEVVPAPKSTAPAPGAAPDLPFPTPEALKKGFTTSEIRAQFGAPAFDIVGSREGHVLEKFYYVNRDKSRLTVLNMDNGLLTSAEGVSSPYFQLPGVRDYRQEPQLKTPR